MTSVDPLLPVVTGSLRELHFLVAYRRAAHGV
jgi:hypothetical protein